MYQIASEWNMEVLDKPILAFQWLYADVEFI